MTLDTGAVAERPDTPAYRPRPVDPGEVRRRFARGRARPRGVAWFGVRSFWGHLRHFVASAIATEDIDSRDWMTPDDPQALTDRVGRLVAGAARTGATVAEQLGRDLWIDYLADTGDDVTVSQAVARAVFAPYELPDPARPGAFLEAPRGDLLLFGGDTAYPVATADEIRDRIIAPFNQVLAECDDGRRRVLLGIPGNHDWYDGLDGFGRMFRRHADFDTAGQARPTLHGSTRTLLGHYAEWAREFVRGGQVGKPKTLDLIGYTAVQGASYFILPVAPGLSILGVDRQLKQLDTRQQRFFQGWLDHHLAVAPWLLLPDPVYAFGEPSPTGTETIQALGLTLPARPHLVLSGDIHHYRREVEGPTLHVTAGGGGAFLHPAPIARGSARPALAEWPDAAQSRALLWQIPWKVAAGRSGLIPHIVLALMLAPVVLSETSTARLTAAALVAAAAIVALALFGNLHRTLRAPPLLLAAFTGMAAPALCLLLRDGLEETLAPQLAGAVAGWVLPAIELSLSALVGVLLFGAYLALLTRFGYDNLQAFAALDHPGYKHFLRLRVRRDGSGVDGYCIGLVDPARPGERPVLVDTFTWKSR